MLSERIFDAPLFDRGDVAQILQWSIEAIHEWFDDTGAETISYNEIKSTVMQHIEIHLEVAAHVCPRNTRIFVKE
ncbi:hypothetical protein [Aurantiacibacter hainanensis]|uniref:hypothetical protein n=1 Tax=Aurantiacibacter hainanensis TaxID=3076114 RepID=UPI0030C6D73F